MLFLGALLTSKLECITNFGPIGGATLCVVAFLLYFFGSAANVFPKSEPKI
jgi:hypothetical protein